MIGKTICAMVLMSSAGAVSAAWVKLSQNEIGDNFYYDTATVSKTDTRTVWILINYGKPDKSRAQEIQSVKYLMQANCSDKSTRELMSYSYSRSNGEGKPVVSSDAGGKWQSLQRNSPERRNFHLLPQRRALDAARGRSRRTQRILRSCLSHCTPATVLPAHSPRVCGRCGT